MDPEERQPQAPNRQANMQSRRIDLEREISIRVPAFDSFVTEYSANVSTTGMFIRSDKPLPPDTTLGFEFKVADDWKLIRGKATVVWSRYRDEGPERPAGMGVLFTELDAQSRRLIGWIIEKHVKDGGTPFDLGELKEEYAQRLAEVPESETAPDQPPPVTRVMAHQKFSGERSSQPTKARGKQPVKSAAGGSPIWRGRFGLIAAALLVAVVLGGLFWLSEKSAQSAANPDLPETDATIRAGGAPGSAAAGGGDPGGVSATVPAESEASPAAEDESTPAASSSPSVTEPVAKPQAPPVDTTPPAVVEAVRQLVAEWSEAWGSQDVDAYLSAYSSRFRPSDGQSRSDWAEVRRQRLMAPEFIEITVSDLEVDWLGDDRARATFTQGYRSNTFQDSMRKVLVLDRDGGRWQILEERAAR